jgi:hypothetical protein
VYLYNTLPIELRKKYLSGRINVLQVESFSICANGTFQLRRVLITGFDVIIDAKITNVILAALKN